MAFLLPGLDGLPHTLHPLILGYEPISEALSVADGNPERFLLEPVTAAALEYEDGWVLLDTGFNVGVIRDRKARERHLNYDSYQTSPSCSSGPNGPG